MATKIFRDPLYNYISIDRASDGWLLDLLDTPSVQRLRRIHQLGVSYLTYPGADHNRLAHSLGVIHLMQQAIQNLQGKTSAARLDQARVPLLAVALLHDVGHGPFSHLFEPCLGIDHEVWSKEIVLCEDKEIGIQRILKGVAPHVPKTVADLIDKGNIDQQSWMRSLLSSQLDVDRLDYLRRDSLFTGAGYGHFDFFRLLNTFELHEAEDGEWAIVWPEKAAFAIEEYIFARYYMYQNVYLHKTTRGFEKMLEAMWRRGRVLHDDGTDVLLVPSLRDFWDASAPTVQQYLKLEEYTVMQQIQNWTEHTDKSLSDLARRFLARNRFAMIEPPPTNNGLGSSHAEWELALAGLVKSKIAYDPEMYVLKDTLKGKYNQPYFPEKEADEQSAKNAIRVLVDGKPVEVSTILPRLRTLTQEPIDRVRYYIPKELQSEAERLRTAMS